MLNDPHVGGLSIDVDTFKGVVTLLGPGEEPRRRRIRPMALARRVSGVVRR